MLHFQSRIPMSSVRGSLDPISHSLDYENHNSFGEVSFVSDSKLVETSTLLPASQDPYGLLLELNGATRGSLEALRRGEHLPPVEQSMTSASFLVYLDPQKQTPLSSPVKPQQTKFSPLQDNTVSRLQQQRPSSAPRIDPAIRSRPASASKSLHETSNHALETSRDEREVVVAHSRPTSRGNRSSSNDLMRESLESNASVEPKAEAFVVHSKCFLCRRFSFLVSFIFGLLFYL
jgi:hypothetical protein